MLKIKKNNKILNLYYTKNLINFNLIMLHKYYNLKILDVSYTGKTYKWSLKKNILKLIFNRAHKTIILSPKKINFKKMSKTKSRFIFNTFKNYKILHIFLYKIRRYNIFTQRGLKIKNNYYYKKKGKISTYR